MMIAPCAIKTIRMVPKIRLSPMAAVPYMVPKRIPLTKACITISTAKSSLLPFNRHSPDIGLANFLVREEIFSPAAHDNFPRLQDIGMMGYLQGLVNILLHKQYPRLLFVQGRDELKYCLHQNWAKPERGLIKHNKLWPGHDGPSNCQHLLFSAAQGAGPLVLAVLQHGEKAIDTLQRFCEKGAGPRDIRTDLQVLQDREASKQAPPFGHMSDSHIHYFLRSEVVR